MEVEEKKSRVKVARTRGRVITFRVDDAEYEILHRKCLESGARSISQFAREATLANQVTIATETLTKIDERLTSLEADSKLSDQQLRRLAELESLTKIQDEVLKKLGREVGRTFAVGG